MPGFYEFFAGGGMARLGLGKGWRCLFAIDFDARKVESYRANFGEDCIVREDVWNLSVSDLPGRADLAWASFPCQDLSLAGKGKGFEGERSAAYWGFVRLLKGLKEQGRLPAVVALENVVGLLHARKGRDFEAVVASLADLGYWVGALVVDAALFVPQSRPRLFVVATLAPPPNQAIRRDPSVIWHSKALVDRFHALPRALSERWIWWDMPAPPRRAITLGDVLEDDPQDVKWMSASEAESVLFQMAETHRIKVSQAISRARILGERIAGTCYRRTRKDEYGRSRTRYEVRFDDIAGCLRTPSGGSSRQLAVVAHPDGKVDIRLLSAREAARLMGIPDDYVLPERYNDAYRLAGDGLAVPVVDWLSRHILKPLVRAAGAGDEMRNVTGAA